MGQRAAVVILFVIAAALAVVAALQFNQAQEAGLRADDAATALADVQAARSTALAEAEAALAAQTAADAARATAVAEAAIAATSAVQAVDSEATAVAEARAAETERSQVEAALATARAQLAADATARVLDEAALATAQEAVAVGATRQAELGVQLATATAALQLAEFARAAAEEDRAEALLRSYAAATAQAEAERALAARAAEPTSAIPTAPRATLVPATAAPTMPPTAALVAEAQPVFRLRDGSLAVQYPPDWLVQEYDGQIFMINSPSVLENPSSDLRPGQFLVNILVLPGAQLRGLEAGADALRFLTVLAESVNSGGQSGIRLGEPAALTLGSYEAARAEGRSATTQTVVMAVDLGQGIFAVAFGNCVPGELELYEPALRDVLASLEYRPPSR